MLKEQTSVYKKRVKDYLRFAKNYYGDSMFMDMSDKMDIIDDYMQKSPIQYADGYETEYEELVAFGECE